MDHAPRHRAARTLLALLAALALLAGACGSSGDESSTDDTTAAGGGDGDVGPVQAGGRLVFALPAETNGWNPATGQWADAGNIVGSTFMEPLMTYTADGGTVPYLAESVEPVDGTDFRVWRIALKPDIRFHDGSPLDAQAVVDSLTFTYKDPASLTAVATRDNFLEATVVDDLTLEVTWNVGYAAFPTSLAGTAGMIMGPAMLTEEDYGADAPIGTGPFRFDSWQRDGNLEVVRNDDYWQEGQPALDGIQFQVIKDPTTRTQALEGGQVDIMLTHTASDIDSMADTDFTVLKDYDSEKTFVLLNGSIPPFDNEHARRALAFATDREELTSRLGEDIVLSDSPTVAGTIWEVPDDEAGYVDFDLDKAREEVELYKAETGAESLSFTLNGLSVLEEQQLMEVLQSQWAEVGIETEVQNLDQTAAVGAVALGGFQAAYWRSYSYLDPDTNFVFWHQSTIADEGLSLNFQRWSTPEISQAMEAARLTDNTDARQTAYREAVQLRNAATIDIWLFNTPTALVAAPEVHGLEGFEEAPFANYLPKPWVNDLWLSR